jgi:transcriptional regulator with PAS, ATPase and Fis domain
LPNVLKHPDDLGLHAVHDILTRAPEMEKPLRLIHRVARADCTVLISGDTGTGKELAAHAIHALSPRRGAAFYARNCATFTPDLLESELFGHVRGAFTGAVREKHGVFRAADQGTLFLDEIADTPREVQGRLLRVLQEKTFVPVGGVRSVEVDVRLISATNRDLRQEVTGGRFRDDLSFRLRVVPVHLPPLRHRTGDVVALFWHFIDRLNTESDLRRISGVTSTAVDALRAYDWPGNVRELLNAVEYAFVVGEGPVLDLDDLPPEVRGETPRSISNGAGTSGERDKLIAALEANRWHRTQAAKDLGISRSTLWRKLREHGLVDSETTGRSAGD